MNYVSNEKNLNILLIFSLSSNNTMYIFQTLDKVSVEIETCSNVESMAMRENIQTVQPGKYKFINQVIDGMTIQINEVNIMFRDPVFYASVQVILYNIKQFFNHFS